MSFCEGGRGGEGRGGEGREGEGRGGEGREGGREGREVGEGGDGWMTVIHILIGMFNSNPMIPQQFDVILRNYVTRRSTI